MDIKIFENPIDDMIVKQARSVTNAGIAQIQAASDGVSSIIGIFTPVLWSRLFEFFAGRPEASPVFFIFGPVSPRSLRPQSLPMFLRRRRAQGGHCVVAGLCRFAAAAACWSIKDEDLYIADSDDPAAVKARLGLTPRPDYRRGGDSESAHARSRLMDRARFDGDGFQLPVLATDAVA